MKLSTYLADNDIKKRDFAKQIGVSAQSISYYCSTGSSKRNPQLKTIMKIIEATNNQVRAEDFFKESLIS